ncbi:MAG: hypothetical protein EPO08_17720 [Rhodospirillaceae bacterium]|nr:MAG: hypothetical protein EPO08_17720 [Rhodospirillaceae bacterium]
MAIYSIVPFSGSTDFRGIKITTTASPGDTVHTAQASASLPDHVTLQLTNTDTVDRPYTVQFGGTTSPDDKLTGYVPAGLTVTVCDKKPIRNNLVVKVASISATVLGNALTGAANVLVAHGYVQRQTA